MYNYHFLTPPPRNRVDIGLFVSSIFPFYPPPLSMAAALAGCKSPGVTPRNTDDNLSDDDPLVYRAFLCFFDEETSLGFVCFCCYQPSCVVSQPTELIWAFLFHKFSNCSTPPPPHVSLGNRG